MSRHVKTGLVVFGGVLLGRLVGFVRDLLVASLFGRTVQADVAVLVMTVPDTLLNILVGGAMGAALIPEFKRRTESEGWRLFGQTARVVFFASVVVTAVLSLSAGLVVQVLAQGVAPAAVSIARPLVATCLWAVPLTALAAVCRAFLQSRDKFVAPSMSAFLYNLTLVGALAFAGANRLPALAVAAIIGAAIGLVVQLRGTFQFRSTEVAEGWLVGRSLVMRFGQALGAGVMLLLMPVVLRSFASRFGEGGLTQAHLASKLVDLPLGVALTSVSVALFPDIAQRLAIEKTREQGADLAKRGLRVIASLGVPISLGLGFFALDWARLLYGHGRMTPAETVPIGMFASVLLVGLLPMALNTLVLTVFDSLRDMVTPFVVTCAGLVAMAATSAIAAGGGNLPALAWASALVHWFMLVILLVVARQRHKISLFEPVFGKVAVTQTVATVAVFLALALPVRALSLPSGLGVLASVAIGLCAGAVGLATDPDTRVMVMGIIKSKLGGRK